MRKILFVTSEAHPLMKTGGLGDVCGGLPQALQALGADVRLLLPAYHDTLQHTGRLKKVAQLTLPPLAQPVTLLEGKLPGTRVTVWLIDFAPAYDRPGNPYLNAHGHPWHDNAARFALLAQVAVAIARDAVGLAWRPDVVHAHDWQAGLVPALLATEATRPATVFTIHNLAYQGLFPYDTFQSLHLPASLWSLHALEFHGQMSFIKGGIAFADRITTVSPTYAREIQTPEHGYGLDGLLQHRATRLSGILNGIDAQAWNPARDPHLVSRYSLRRLTHKLPNKTALQQEFNLQVDAGVALFGMVSRMVDQKGVDLLLDALPTLMALPLQIVVLGSGEAQYEQALRAQAARYPDRLAVLAGYDEAVAHRIQAGVDFFLMPSRFEPCGLSQLYSLRYGTVPVVRRVGGLADTVVDANSMNIAAGTATGIVFEEASAEALTGAVQRALALHAERRTWKQIQLTGMHQDFSWQHSAAEYLSLYEAAIKDLPQHSTASPIDANVSTLDRTTPAAQ
jgi:starch synthase